MIDVIISDTSCPHCDIQRATMNKSFFSNEYRIISLGSADFESYDLKEQVDAVPYVVVRDDETGEVKYAKKGTVDGTSLRQIERVGSAVREQPVYNLRAIRQARQRETQTAYMQSRMD
jgi:glutaredoxin